MPYGISKYSQCPEAYSTAPDHFEALNRTSLVKIVAFGLCDLTILLSLNGVLY